MISENNKDNIEYIKKCILYDLNKDIYDLSMFSEKNKLKYDRESLKDLQQHNKITTVDDKNSGKRTRANKPIPYSE